MPLTQKKFAGIVITYVTNKAPLAILKSKWAKYTNNKTTAMVESMVFSNKNVGKRSTTSLPGSSLFLPSRGSTQVENPRNEVELSRQFCYTRQPFFKCVSGNKKSAVK